MPIGDHMSYYRPLKPAYAFDFKINQEITSFQFQNYAIIVLVIIMIKYLAVTIIACLFLCFMLLFLVPILTSSEFNIFNVLLGVIILSIIICFLYVFVQRIKEIKEENEDDITKY